MANVTDWKERLGDRLTEGERYPPPFQQWFFAFFWFYLIWNHNIECWKKIFQQFQRYAFSSPFLASSVGVLGHCWKNSSNTQSLDSIIFFYINKQVLECWRGGGCHRQKVSA